MYKVLVVDDEPSMLEGWKTMVDWQACGYELCGTATDGEEALVSIRTFEPDLVVTDIRMPVLDGLGLIRAMKEDLGVSAKTVVVSGYSEFSYAQQALRYQVDRYLLKPLMTEEIHCMLLELVGPLKQRRFAEASAGREQAAAAAAAIVGLLQNGGPAAVETAALLLGANEQTRCRLILAESSSGFGSGGAVWAADGSPSIHARLQELIEAGFHGGKQAFPFEESPGRAGMLLLDDGLDEEQFARRLTKTAAMLAWPLRELALYCSGGAYGLAAVPELYRQAMETRSRSLLGRGAGVQLYHERTAVGHFRLEHMTSYAGELLRAIEAGEVESIGSCVDGLLLAVERSGVQEGWIRTAVQYICGELLRKYSGTEGSSGDASEWLRQLLYENDLADTASWSGNMLKLLCIRTAERLAERKAPARTNRTAVTEAVDYLKSHYREKIQLQELAERVHLNPVYFGQQFKRETGIGLNEYIHRLRMDEAKLLLRRTDMKVSEIAQTLGYHDAEYFTGKFKELVGEPPSIYKKQVQR
jgi:two-component system response regulator YesN